MLTTEEIKIENKRALANSLEENVRDASARLSSIYEETEEAESFLDKTKLLIGEERTTLVSLQRSGKDELFRIDEARKGLAQERVGFLVGIEKKEKALLNKEKASEKKIQDTDRERSVITLEINALDKRLKTKITLDKDLRKLEAHSKTLTEQIEEKENKKTKTLSDINILQDEYTSLLETYETSEKVLQRTLDTIGVEIQRKQKDIRDTQKAMDERVKRIALRERELLTYESRLRKHFDKIGINMK